MSRRIRAGKSELAYEIYRLLSERGTRTEVLQQDDYFVFPPRTNHEMRTNLEQVGPFEVKLDFLDSNLRSFKRGRARSTNRWSSTRRIGLPTEELDVADLDLLVAEGTYTSLLRFVDVRVFIDRNYRQTLAARNDAPGTGGSRSSRRCSSGNIWSSGNTRHLAEWSFIPADFFLEHPSSSKGAVNTMTKTDWYKDAIFYEVFVRAFSDGIGDGIGDLRGSRQKARLPTGPRHRLHLVAADLSLTAEG